MGRNDSWIIEFLQLARVLLFRKFFKYKLTIFKTCDDITNYLINECV